MTATIRAESTKQALMIEGYENFTIRTVHKDFQDYGGIFKVEFERDYGPNATHYMVQMNKHHTSLLASYRTLNVTDLEGMAVTKNEKQLFKVENGSLHHFPDYDTFHAHGFKSHGVIVLFEEEFDRIPMGETRAPLDFQGEEE